MNKRISISVMVLLLAWATYFFVSNWQDFSVFFNVAWDAAAWLLATTLLFLIIQGMLLREVVRPHNIELQFREWFGSIVVTLMGNYIVPFAGVGFRAGYLKKVHGLAFKDFTATLSAIYVMEFLVFSLGGLSGLLYLQHLNGRIDIVLLFLFLGTSAFFTAILLFSPRLPRFDIKIWLKALELLDSWYHLKQYRPMLFRLAVYTIVEFLLYSVMFYFAYRAFSFVVPLMSVFVVSALSDFSFFLRIAPAALGTYEASILYSSSMYGLTVAQSLLVVALMRISTMAWFFTLGPVYSYILVGHITSTIDDGHEQQFVTADSAKRMEP